LSITFLSGSATATIILKLFSLTQSLSVFKLMG
ncbi:MAG: hypothetical protein ACI95X_001680, partial [Paraglaciecola sp.]